MSHSSVGWRAKSCEAERRGLVALERRGVESDNLNAAVAAVAGARTVKDTDDACVQDAAVDDLCHEEV